jgi:Mce-associated membrane protein
MSASVNSDTDREPDAGVVEDTDAAEAAETDTADAKTARGLADPVTRSNTLLVVAGALLLVCAVAAVWFGISWARSSNNEDLDFAKQRDDVARVAGTTIIALNSIDYHQIDKSFDQIVNTMTADAQKDFLANKDKWKSLLVQGKIVSKAALATENGRQAVAVESLNTHDGTASVMVVVNVTVTPEGQQPTMPRERYILQMTRTGDGWKTSSFDPVTVYPAGQ